MILKTSQFLLVILCFVTQCAIMKSSTVCFQTTLEAFLHHNLNYWIGLTDLDVEGTFVWQSNSEEASYTHWYPGEPNNFDGQEHCTLLVRNSFVTT